MGHRHIRSLVMRDKSGRERTLETDLLNREISEQYKGWKIDRERDLRASKTKGEETDDDD